MNEHIERIVESFCIDEFNNGKYRHLVGVDDPFGVDDLENDIKSFLRTALTSTYNAGLERAKNARETLNILNEESVEDVLSALASKNAAIEKEKIESSPEL